METGNVPDRSNNVSVSIGLQNVMDRYGTKKQSDIMETLYKSIRPDLKVLLNSDLIPLLKLIMLSPGISILLVWVVLVFPVTASLVAQGSLVSIHYLLHFSHFFRKVI